MKREQASYNSVCPYLIVYQKTRKQMHYALLPHLILLLRHITALRILLI